MSLHEGEVSVEPLPDGRFRFVNRYGVRLDRPVEPPRSDPAAIVKANRKAGLRIDRETACDGT